ncbi:cytochrome C [Zhengella mangrovi]|uniref:Cytochrome C n=1 Tax=Zhengella mangrovi TaxID=1982044 RepID=A0A2G1QSG7_9HYPH|nr:cytochrome c [Zhengella mangrovi]PHP68487.1 cytochrome C [Zhengella mangrovi]
MRNKIILAAVALSLGGAAAAFAHGGATGIVKERMEAMESMGDTMKALKPMMQGAVAYDADAVRQGARSIRDHAAKIQDLFPEGSGGHPSEARPEVWTERSDFDALAKRLQVLAAGLKAAAGNDTAMPGSSQGMMGSGQGMMMGGQGMMGGGQGMMMGAVGPLPDPSDLAAMPAGGVFAMVAQTCSACHSRFRQEDE